MLNTDLWRHFTASFSAAIADTPDNDLAEAWSTLKARTNFYRKKLTPLTVTLGAVIEQQLEPGNELFKVDFAISRDSNGVKVPIIFIESENNVVSADHEVRKLVNLAAPLRVLITVSQWDESGIWEGGGNRTRLLSEWEKVIRQHQIVWPRPGVVGFLIGEWRPNKTFRFYAYAYDEGNRLPGPASEILLEREVGCEDPRLAPKAPTTTVPS